MRIAAVREHAEYINEQEEAASERLIQAEYQLEAARSMAEQARAAMAYAGPDDDVTALAARAEMYESLVSEAAGELSQRQKELQAVEQDRAETVRDVTRYLEQESTSIDEMRQAAGASPYGADAIAAAINGMEQSITQGEDVLGLLGGSWSRRSVAGGAGGGQPSASTGTANKTADAVGLASMDGTLGVGSGEPTLPDTSQLLDSFRQDLWSAIEPDRVKSLYDQSGSRVVWRDEEELRTILDEYEGLVANIPGGDAISRQLRAEWDSTMATYREMRSEGAVTASVPQGSTRSPGTNTSAGASWGLNSTSHEDTMSAFEFLNEQYSQDSAEWQEGACRARDSLLAQRAEVDRRIDDILMESSDISAAAARFVETHDMDHLAADEYETYQSLTNQHQALRRERVELTSRIQQLDERVATISGAIDQERETRFVGAHGSDFEHSYDGIITDRQGKVFAEIEGCCGIGETYSLVNQQRGTKVDWEEAIRNFSNEHPPQMLYLMDEHGDGIRFRKWNGATTYEQRRHMLEKEGLRSQRIATSKGRHSEPDLDMIARRLDQGDSAGLTLKAQDLEQSGLSSRSILAQLLNRRDDSENMDPRAANHAVTVAGYSVNRAGKVCGLWINDTGGCTGSNRVYLSREKFEAMRRETDDFGVEFAWKEGAHREA